MIHETVMWVFSFVCHQEAALTWAPGGVPLALCQRCTGVYAGSALMLLLLPWMCFRPSRFTGALHTVLILQMVFFTGHLLPHPASVRTLSGQVFIAGVYYFVWTHLSVRIGLTRDDRSPRAYGIGLLAALLILQGLVHAPFRWAAPVLELLSLIGVLGLLIAVAATIADLALHSRYRRSAR